MTQALTTLNNNNLFPENDAQSITLGGAEELFGLIDDDDVESLQDKTEPLTVDNWKLCTNCNIDMQRFEAIYRCGSCGKTKNIIEADDNYNPSAEQYNTKNTSASLRIVGTGSYRYGRAFIASSAPHYSETQKKQTTKQLHRLNVQNQKKITFPIIILQETAELFNQIQSLEVVRRGNGRLGTIAACLDFVCQKNGITKKPKVIADFVGIEESDLSRGDKLLRQLHSEQKIDILIHHNPIKDYIRQNFENLDIDIKYLDFIVELIKAASDETKCTPNNAQQSTKCAGAIYALGLQENLDFNKADVEKVCAISKATFLRYYEFLVLNRRTLNAVFKKYGIPRLRSKSKTVKRPKAKKQAKKEPVGKILQIV